VTQILKINRVHLKRKVFNFSCIKKYEFKARWWLCGFKKKERIGISVELE
jgi:hypothetical protein